MFYYIVAIGLCLFIGYTGSIFTANTVNNWYLTIEKSSLTPPPIVFPIVWTTLYILMGIGIARIWHKKGITPFFKKINLLFFSQLTLNFLWSIFFFGMKNPDLAFINIIMMIFLVAWLTIELIKVDKIASYCYI
jgi:tryptophan-rich sensory protein